MATQTRLPGLLLLLLLSAEARALDIRLCTFDRPFPPHTMPDGSGQVQELLRRAAATAAIAIKNINAPRARCVAELRVGEVDALVAAFLPERQEFGVYPMAGKRPDPARALATARFNVYRRRGGTAYWDGKRLANLGAKPVGVQAGFVHGPMLRELGVAVDDGARSTEQNLGKLAYGRLSVAIALEHEAAPIIAQQYKGQIEPLPLPFHLTELYLLVNRKFYQEHKREIDDYWSAIAQQRRSASYQQYLLRAH